MDETEQLEVWRGLPQRLQSLSVNAHLLPWTGDELAGWACETLTAQQGTWVTGVPGAVAEFPADGEIAVEREPERIVARSEKARFVLRLHEKLRAFAFNEGAPIVLGIPKVRARLEIANSFTCLGADAEAVDADYCGWQAFDFGLGRASSRFCLRTGDPELAASLQEHVGSPWQTVMGIMGARILAASPHRVVESTCARIEVLTPIPAPGTVTPPGAHTHFLPEFLATGEEVPAGLSLPDFALPVAIFYPGPHAD
jgi:hypothetical protein